MQRHIWDIAEIEALAFAICLGMDAHQRQGVARLLLALGIDAATAVRVCRLSATGEAAPPMEVR